jgi:hypothetical protein
MSTKWNKKFQSASSNHKSPLNQMNIGVSYFVTPLNQAQETADAGRDKVIVDLSKIVKKFDASEERLTKHMSEEM